jgi:hypothetical protein
VFLVSGNLKIGAYYYPGWHSCDVRDAAFPKGWSEWDLVYDCAPRFKGHEQPNLPLWGRLDESKPQVFDKKIATALDYGIELFVFAFYWSRGKLLLQGALDRGFLRSKKNGGIEFALMWANRMPRKVLPVKSPNARSVNPERLVYTDSDDFLDFIKYIGKNYFTMPNYHRYEGGCFLSIFDTNFFLRQMGEVGAKEAIGRARDWLFAQGFGALHLSAIDPIPSFQPRLREIGFDSVTHYVFLPEWRGKRIQDFERAYKTKCKDWYRFPKATGLPYFPSVSPGWDANPRAVDYGKEKPRRYPWSPIITGRSPDKFEQLLCEAARFTRANNRSSPLFFISSWNEWSEGHYLEPDKAFGYKWLEAVRNAKGRSKKNR